MIAHTEPQQPEERLGPRALGVTAFVGTLLAFACLARYGLSARGFIAAYTAAVLTALSAIDIERRVLPNRIVVPSAVLVLAAQIAFFPDRWLEWVLASLGAALFFLVAHLVYPAGLGMGDVKLALLLGAALGSSVVEALFIGSLAAAAWGVVLLARQGSDARKQAIPLGPFLAFGAVVTLLLG